MRILLFSLGALCFPLITLAQSPVCEWVNFPTGSNSNYTYGYSSTYDLNGNSFVIGAFDAPTGTLDIDPSVNTHSLSGNGIFVAKYDPSGAVVWLAPIVITSLSSQAGIALPSIACDNAGDVYITSGVKDVTIDFDYVSASNTPFTTSGGGDMYLAKYSSAGAPLWSFLIGDAGNEEGQTIVCEGAKVYVGGFYGTNTDFDPSAGTYIPAVPLACSAGL